MSHLLSWKMRLFESDFQTLWRCCPKIQQESSLFNENVKTRVFLSAHLFTTELLNTIVSLKSFRGWKTNFLFRYLWVARVAVVEEFDLLSTFPVRKTIGLDSSDSSCLHNYLTDLLIWSGFANQMQSKRSRIPHFSSASIFLDLQKRKQNVIWLTWGFIDDLGLHWAAGVPDEGDW